MKKKSVRTLADLVERQLISEHNVSDLEKVIENFSLAIPNQMIELINQADPTDPIAKQFVPNVQELKTSALERHDPIGDKNHTAVKGIVHRYPDRCLFTPVHVCPIYCRFCFRREKVGTASETLTASELATAYAYIEAHPEIWEVILTGGDPLILKPNLLQTIIEHLSAIQHVEVIRIHTRVPMVESHRITPEMISALQNAKPVYIVIHANHPNEFTDAAKKTFASFATAGIPLLSQTTLLKGINDNIDALSLLMRCFIKNRIKPYYLHHADLVPGTKHFRTSIATGQALMKQLRGRFSGICQPTYVLDIPGGHGKMPIGPQYIKLDDDQRSYLVEDYCGHQHHYMIENDSD